MSKFINKIKKLFNKKEAKTMQTEKEIKKADGNIDKADDKSEQSNKDRVDESVAEQEKDSGTTDSQTAEDRVDESEGEQKEEKVEAKPKEESTNAIADAVSKALEPILKKLEILEQAMISSAKQPSAVEDNETLKTLDALEHKYNN